MNHACILASFTGLRRPSVILETNRPGDGGKTFHCLPEACPNIAFATGISVLEEKIFFLYQLDHSLFTISLWHFSSW